MGRRRRHRGGARRQYGNPDSRRLRIQAVVIKTLTDAPALRRRLLTVPAVFGIAVSLTALAPVWIIGAVVADVALLRRRLPTLRLMAFAWCWAWFEVAG